MGASASADLSLKFAHVPLALCGSTGLSALWPLSLRRTDVEEDAEGHDLEHLANGLTLKPRPLCTFESWVLLGSFGFFTLRQMAQIDIEHFPPNPPPKPPPPRLAPGPSPGCPLCLSSCPPWGAWSLPGAASRRPPAATHPTHPGAGRPFALGPPSVSIRPGEKKKGKHVVGPERWISAPEIKEAWKGERKEGRKEGKKEGQKVQSG